MARSSRLSRLGPRWRSMVCKHGNVLGLAWFNVRARWAEWRGRQADTYLPVDVVARVNLVAGKGHYGDTGQIRVSVLFGSCVVGGLMWFGLWVCVRWVFRF